MSKLDEIRNQFRERLTVREVPTNARIHVIKVENQFNDTKSDSRFAAKDPNVFKNSTFNTNRNIPQISGNERKFPIISSVKDGRSSDNKLISGFLNRNPLKTELNKELKSFGNSLTHLKTTKSVNKTANQGLKTKRGFNKEVDIISKKPMISRQTRLTNFRSSSAKDKPKISTDRVSSGGMPCRFCGRCFALSERLQKHETVCNSSVIKPIQKFDSIKQRFKGLPNDYLTIYENSLNNGTEEPTKKCNNWRQKHEYCVAAIRAARGDSSTGPTTSQIMASIQQQCDYCKRRFNEEAIKRHLPICAKLFHKKVINY